MNEAIVGYQRGGAESAPSEPDSASAPPPDVVEPTDADTAGGEPSDLDLSEGGRDDD